MGSAREHHVGNLRSAIAILAWVIIGSTGTPLLAQTPEPPSPYGGVITLEIFAIDDTIIHGDQSPEERILREAQYVLAGMIYGWDFIWVPAFPARGVERFFALEPLGSIAWGDPRLELRDLRDLRREDNAIYGQLDFSLSDTDAVRLEAWAALETERSRGIDTAALQQGLPGRVRAIEEAIHEGIRDHFRSITFNPPREVRGSVLLERQPRIRTMSGLYEAEVRILIRVDEVLEYRVF